MAKTTTEKGLIDPSVPAQGTCGIYATDDGMVQLVSKHDGITRTIEFTPEEWAGVAVGGIELGVVARSAAQAKAPLPVSPLKLTPQMAKLLAKANGRS